MSGHAGGPDVRERDERDARFFAWDVPGDAHVVALVHESQDAERSATVADAIATSVARRREHTLLLSAEAGPSPLDELLGAANSEGLPAALEGRARLTDVAVQRVDRPFVYLPGGADPIAMRALLEDQVLTSFVERVRDRGGTLFIVLSEETLKIEPLRTLIDGYVALGDVALSEAETSLAQFGRVRFDNGDSPSTSANGGQARVADVPGLPPLPEPAAGESSVDAPPAGQRDDARAPVEGGRAAAGTERVVDGPSPIGEKPPVAMPVVPAAGPAPAHETETAPSGEDGWKRHRQTPAFPTKRVGIGAVGLLGVAAIWWLIAGGFGGTSGSAADAEPASSAGASLPPQAASSPPAFDEAGALAAFEAAPALGHSVMIASFAVADDAANRLGEIRASDAGFYFVSPTPVRGVVYHRVFAGALDSRDAAQTLMDQLVAGGIKDEAGAWHLRPAALAFDLGVFPDRAASDARVAALEGQGIPAYALPAAGGDGPWRVYGGAYADQREAAPMGDMLTAVGEPAELISRRGSVAR
ncbi:MAG: SPOR domain-containing protein [Gemmatimonadota bacterium]|nr:SPOR domain-containing protein [Gemmatimonadota bacterium]